MKTERLAATALAAVDCCDAKRVWTNPPGPSAIVIQDALAPLGPRVAGRICVGPDGGGPVRAVSHGGESAPTWARVPDRQGEWRRRRRRLSAQCAVLPGLMRWLERKRGTRPRPDSDGAQSSAQSELAHGQLRGSASPPTMPGVGPSYPGQAMVSAQPLPPTRPPAQGRRARPTPDRPNLWPPWAMRARPVEGRGTLPPPRTGHGGDGRRRRAPKPELSDRR